MSARTDSGTGSSGGRQRASTDAKKLQTRVGKLSKELARAQGRIKALEERVQDLRTARPAVGRAQSELKVLSEQYERQLMLLERDEHVARELQENLRPVLDQELEGLSVAIEAKAGVRVGGDFYDIIDLPDGFVAFLIADVSGYGLPAAVIMATGRLAFRANMAMELRPRVVMEQVNKAMLRSILAGHYLTAFLAVLDTELLTLQYVNGSHCTPFVLRDNEVIALDTEGLFVGMFEDPQYEQKGVQLERNDRVFLYTDGLLRGFEAKNRQDAEARLRDFLKDNSALDLNELVSRLGSLSPEPEDDVALLGVELRKEKARAKTIVISSIPGRITHVENAILPALQNKGYGERTLFGVKLALEEAIINAIKHGNELDDTKKVTVEFRLQDDRAVIVVGDEGEGFDPDQVPDATALENLTAATGRGLTLIRAYMDEVSFNEKGNEIAMVKYAPWATETAGKSGGSHGA